MVTCKKYSLVLKVMTVSYFDPTVCMMIKNFSGCYYSSIIYQIDFSSPIQLKIIQI